MQTRLPSLLLTAASLAMLANGCALPGPGGADTNAGALRMSHTCKNPNQGNVFREPDGGYHESPQGWFIRAEVHQSSTWAIAYCYYGLDLAAPANRPVYSVHYEMTGFKSTACSVSGATVTCTPVLQP